MTMTTKDIATEVCGYAGALFLTFMTFPQVYHCFKNKTTKGLATSFILLEFLTSLSFTAYGALLPSVHVIIANSAALLGSILLIVAKLSFAKERKQCEKVEQVPSIDKNEI